MSELIPWIVAVVGIASTILTWYYYRRQALSKEEELRLKKKEIEEIQTQNQNMRRFLENKQRELSLKKAEMGYSVVKDIASFLQSLRDADDADY